MGKYFGTDGVRGIANRELSPELAFRIGRCGGYVLTRQAEKPTVLIGMDTRISGAMLEAALVAGLLSIGAKVIRLGVITTPGVAYLTRKLGADAGVMISASHNPVEDNGIKFFGSDGFKLSDETELEIEKLLDEEVDRLPRPIGGELGTVQDDFEAKRLYADYLKTTVKNDSFQGLRIVMDCANGAAYDLAPRIFRELGAEVITIANQPDGLNINDHCGSTHPERLKAAVVEYEAHLGLSFDGDADRLIAVDEHGEEVDGDYIMCICADAMQREGRLRQNTVVATVMSNLGFFKALESKGLRAEKTAVGDRYVMEAMRQGGYNLGGEQSGHIIFLDYNTTGDGMLSALQLVDVLVASGKTLGELKQVMTKYPQVLQNIRVSDKSLFKGNARIEEAIREAEQLLGDQGRVLVRPSGTEPLIRVMVEGPEKTQIEQCADRIAQVIKEELDGVKHQDH